MRPIRGALHDFLVSMRTGGILHADETYRLPLLRPGEHYINRAFTPQYIKDTAMSSLRYFTYFPATLQPDERVLFSFGAAACFAKDLGSDNRRRGIELLKQLQERGYVIVEKPDIKEADMPRGTPRNPGPPFPMPNEPVIGWEEFKGYFDAMLNDKNEQRLYKEHDRAWKLFQLGMQFGADRVRKDKNFLRTGIYSGMRLNDCKLCNGEARLSVSNTPQMFHPVAVAHCKNCKSMIRQKADGSYTRESAMKFVHDRWNELHAATGSKS